MSALLNDTTVYLIGMADCFKAVSNNNYCLVARKSLDSFLQTVLIIRINICRCLVKNNDRSIF